MAGNLAVLPSSVVKSCAGARSLRTCGNWHRFGSGSTLSHAITAAWSAGSLRQDLRLSIRPFLNQREKTLTTHDGASAADRPEGASSPKSAEGMPKIGSEEQPKTSSPKLRIWWSNMTILSKAIVGLATIIAAVPIIYNVLSKETTRVLSPAEADARILNSLNAGELFSAFQHSLGVSPKVNLWGGSRQMRYPGGSVSISDYLFVLHTVYVEAFVGSNDTVDAYTVTARTHDMPQGIKILGRLYSLGKMTLADAPLGGIASVVAVCGAHIAAYYEISYATVGPAQTVAVGLTESGSIPNSNFHWALLPCSYPATDSLPISPGSSQSNGMATLWSGLVERIPTKTYLANSLSLRRRMYVNAITVTAPGYPVAPQMISLNPMSVAPYAPNG